MSKDLSLPSICACMLLASAPTALWSQDLAGRIFVTEIAPNFDIVSEVSQPRPYLGQQISIVYSLRALVSPTAVDVEPQEYTGFWTETIPLPQETRFITRIVNGRRVYEFMLRQVIAYPLAEGDLKLPPLGVKIKTVGDLTAGSPVWDITAESRPVPIRVRPLPSFPGPGKGPSLVGNIIGRLKQASSAEDYEILLEVQGTANLAFFNPRDWFRYPSKRRLPPRLLSAENDVQTRDIGGKRLLTVTQRQQWSIRFFSDGANTVQVEDIMLPVLQPDNGTWRVVRIAGLSLEVPNSDASIQDSTPLRSPRSSQGSSNSWVPAGRLVLLLGASGTLLFGLIRIWWVRRRGAYSEAWRHRNLAILETQCRSAPRSFLETAHRILDRYAAENHLIPGVGGEDSAFDRCWSQVEKSRFVAAEMSSRERARILQSIRTLLTGRERLPARGGDLT